MPPLTARVSARSRGRDWNCRQSVFLFSLRARAGQFPPRQAQEAQQASLPESQLPPVSILKPLKGVDPEIWESFCSHCEQDYPEFQMIFGVSDPADPAIEVVRKLQAKYPELPIELIVCERVLGTNIKVSNLAQMLPAARHEILLVNDSDIRVPADYLRQGDRAARRRFGGTGDLSLSRRRRPPTSRARASKPWASAPILCPAF